MMSTFVVGLVSFLIAAAMAWKKQASALTSSSSVHIPPRSAVLVTGCSRGIGKHLAETLSLRGYTVLGTVRSQSSYKALQEKEQQDVATAGRIHPILLDVTDQGQCQKAVEEVRSIMENQYEPPLQLVGIINNAGINPEGDQWKQTTEEENNKNGENNFTPSNTLSDPLLAEEVLATNVMGCIRVTHAFVPLLQQQASSAAGKNIASGRIILIGSYFGSLAGAIGLPHIYYETSKHALEGLADGMRRGFQQQQRQQGQTAAAEQESTPTTTRLRPVDVSLIKPGNIRTDMNDYGEAGPEEVSKTVLQALESPRPKHRYYPGTVKGMSSYVLCTIFEILPTWLTDKLL
jgi:NAD(P)-dependent dehydrogenase (short-subunit alcohol dehydrogenase family)